MAEVYSPKILTGGESKSDDEILAAHDQVRRVSGPGLPGADDSPLVIMELLQRFKVRDVMKRTVISVSRDTKMREAQRLLTSYKKMRISEIAQRTGFTDQKYFCRTYHGYFGHAPSRTAK